ncbi:MAG TPA: serine/threonine-protein kinase [Kofleriaceae bacterium]|nr:serine/threonine-protein kinase [Kofleriaceae bacterium]
MDDDAADDQGTAPTIESPSGELGSAGSLLRAIADAPGKRDPGPLARGQLVGRKYEVVRAIGEGGMGVVYLARDTRLARDVALKVGSAISPAALARMEREAQALARLSHPNVVVVYEVGEVDGRVFVAMELVAGGTARAWSRDRAKSAREIIAMYCAAGDGLAAAHAAGIVHRDFKPDNVLVGDDDRPRVADFGLARDSAERAPDPGAADSSSIEVTRAGSIVGTPAYMAPEQLDGEPVDARADQFAFCAALWEALHGVRPFGGDTPADVRAAIETLEPRTKRDDGGAGRAARAARAIPRHVDAALRRGLRVDPDARWPSMSALLAELRRDPARRRRNALLAGGAVAAIAAAAIIPLALRDHAPAPCSDDAAAIAPTWSDARTAAIAAAFERAGAGRTWAVLRPRLDRYARDWIGAHHAACKATRLDGSQSEAILDRRMLCLGAARAQLDAVLTDLTRTDHTAVQRAPDVLAVLPDLSACADVATLTKQAPLPADPRARAAIEDGYREAAAARLATVRGDARDPVAAGDHLVATARATRWPPLVARAAYLRASLLLDAGRVAEGRAALEDAITQELSAGDDHLAAFAMADLAWDLAGNRKATEAEHWLALARPLWTRTGEDPDLGVRLLGVESMVALTRGRFDDAIAIAKRQQVLMRKAYGDEPFDDAGSHRNLSLAYINAGRFLDGEREGRLALDEMERALGKDHPLLSIYDRTLAIAEMKLGKIAESIAHFQRAIAIADAWYGPDSPAAGDAMMELATAQGVNGDEAGARSSIERAIAIETKRDPHSRTLPDLETNLGVMLAQFGHLADARPHAAHALDEHIPILGADNPDLNSDYILLAYVDRGLGRLDDAEREGREAVRVVEKTFGTDNPNAVNPRIELSYTLVAEKKYADAAALLEPMVALSERDPQVTPPAAAEVHTAYADALWRAGGDRDKARAAAVKGRDSFAALGAPYDPQRAQADAWLREHR